jgi:hypothetical protein|tara:strand:- start:358 stop:615 length:258 start_codon:yes stop_codon:yes gene_type:complete
MENSRKLTLKCLRDKKTHRILNVCYSEDGLKQTYNKVGKKLYNLDSNYVADYKEKDFSDIHNKNLRSSLEKSEKYYSVKANILNK